MMSYNNINIKRPLLQFRVGDIKPFYLENIKNFESQISNRRSSVKQENESVQNNHKNVKINLDDYSNSGSKKMSLSPRNYNDPTGMYNKNLYLK